MATYTNPYGYVSPLGDAFARLGQTIMSGPTQAQRVMASEQALKLKTTRENTQSVADLFRQGPEAYGANRNDIIANSIVAGINPNDVGGYERYGVANAYGASDPRTTNAVVGAGAPYSSTAQAFNIDQGNQNTRAANVLAETTREYNQKPIDALVDGKPVYVPQSQAFGPGVNLVLPESTAKGVLVQNNWDNLDKLSSPQQRYLFGVAQPTSHNYVDLAGVNHMTVDDLHDLQTGALLPQGGHNANITGDVAGTGLTGTNRSTLQGDTIANNTLRAELKIARDSVNASPDSNFGITGNIKGLAQNAAVVATNLASGLGFKAPADALNAFQAEMQKDGIDPTIISGVFDPRLGELETVYGTLVYATARAMSGSGTLSNQDIQAARAAIGDPGGLMSNKQTLISKLDAIEKLLNAKQGVVDQALSGKPGAVTAPSAAQPAPAAAATPAIKPPPPPVGLIQNGYQFKGGDPADPASWQKL